MSDVREYLKLQYPYLKRINNILVELSKKYPEGIQTDIDAFDMLRETLDIARDAVELTTLYQEFINGRIENIKLYGYSENYIEFYDDIFTLPEHKRDTISFGMN